LCSARAVEERQPAGGETNTAEHGELIPRGDSLDGNPRIKSSGSRADHLRQQIEHLHSQVQPSASQVENPNPQPQHLVSQVQLRHSQVELLDSQIQNRHPQIEHLNPRLQAANAKILHFANKRQGFGKTHTDTVPLIEL